MTLAVLLTTITPLSSVGPHEAVLQSEPHQFSPVLKFELGHDVGPMGFYCADAHAEFLGDFGVGTALLQGCVVMTG